MRLPSLFILTTAHAFVFSSARADYVADFTLPPKVEERSIIGTDGWDYRLPTQKGDPDTARVVSVRWNGYKPALMLKGANLKCAVPPTTGSKVIITFDLAVTIRDSGNGRPFRIGFGGAPCGELFIDMTADGGLGCQADGSGRGGEIVLKRSEVKNNSFYHCSVTIDYAKQAYAISITGRRKDDSAFQFTTDARPFESKSKAVSTIYIISANSMTAYLDSVAIKSE